MSWYSPIDKPQLLPKDLLHYARKFSKEEAEKHILGLLAVKKRMNEFISQQVSEWEMAALRAQAVSAASVSIGSTTAGMPWGVSITNTYTDTNAYSNNRSTWSTTL